MSDESTRSGGVFPARQGRALTVFALNELARALLERGLPRVWVEGEVTDLVRSAAGHLYFTLGDGRAQVKCLMFRTEVTKAALALTNGARVEVRGGLSLYEPRGTYQLHVGEVVEAGLGARALEVARIKKKLAADGLLDPARKRALPRYPRTIGVVTSRDGAAWRDIVKVALARFPARLVLVHAAVQGPEAPEQIVAALEAIQTERFRSLSVILLARGGGASEDLAAFDDERVARAVAAARVPIVTGVGHEIDVTLADLTADVRAATPSHAAELAVPSLAAIHDALRAQLRGLQRGFDRVIGEHKLALERTSRLLGDPRGLLRAPRTTLHGLERTAERATRAQLAAARQRLLALTERLAPHEPRARLARDRASLSALEARLAPWMERRLGEASRSLAALGERSAPAVRRRLADERLVLSRREERAARGVSQRLALAHRSLAESARALHALSPLAVLDRGYAIATIAVSGQAVRDAGEAPAGTRLRIRLARGVVHADVVDDDDPAS